MKIRPRNPDESAYWQEVFERELKSLTSPAVTVFNVTPKQAAIRRADQALRRYQLQVDGPQLMYCCDELLEAIKDNILEVELPSTVQIFDRYIKYCPFCGKRIEPKSNRHL
jgi:hypothetical protein